MKKSALAFLSFLFVLITAGCSSRPQQAVNMKPARAHVVLIHGMHLDETVWADIIPHLSPSHDVMAVTLPGRMPKENVTLAEMSRFVCDKITHPSVIVGHSFGGAVANQMVGDCPEKVSKIIYVAGVVPLAYEKTFEAIPKEEMREHSKVIEMRKDRIYPRVAKAFYMGMDPGVAEIPRNTLYSESYVMAENIVAYDTATFEKLPKAYILTTRDLMITPVVQQKYIARSKITQTRSIDCGHLPMFSKPLDLAGALLNVIPEAK